MYSAPHRADRLHPYAAADPYSSNNGQFANSNKLYSLSSSDVRLGQAPYAYTPHRHQRQYSDESTFYMGPRLAAAAPRPPGPAGGYYSSMQELPTNSHSQGTATPTARGSVTPTPRGTAPPTPGPRPHTQGHGPPTPRGTATPTPRGTAPPTPRGTAPQGHAHTQGGTPAPLLVPLLTRTRTGTAGRPGGEGQQRHHPERRGPAPRPDPASAAPKPGPEERGPEEGQRAQRGAQLHELPPASTAGPASRGTPSRSATPGCPGTRARSAPRPRPCCTPSPRRARPPARSPGRARRAWRRAPPGGKQVRRSDRFATTLRNEIQLKRAQLQKSRSAAALTGPCEAEEDEAEAEPEAWRPGPAQASSASASSDGSFGGSYKDHLKEAQARVLQATSFRRRDLEPRSRRPGRGRRGLPRPRSRAGRPRPRGAQVSRIGGRKRFSAEKRLRSFSEPDKINEVGVEEEPPPRRGRRVLRRPPQFLRGDGPPGVPKPAPRQAPRSSRGPGEPEPESGPAGGPEAEPEPERDPAHADGQAQLEQQRLGTFAEYEATWNVQRKASEARPSGRYHSADNILDPGAEERSKPSYVHERSRSSPSADFYGENVPIAGRKSAGCSPADPEPAGQEKAAPRVIDGASGEPRERETAAQRADGFLAPPSNPLPSAPPHSAPPPPLTRGTPPGSAPGPGRRARRR
ncbi:hypothetical protein ANANG_G00065470 [Anguilla anguilla]|uniref:ASD1 domain-containing protein n=1 Tax=Anguilla anguilla TaxID=7936 RepID=A0A9D3MPH8_ANGAN|nr:hypothetical protein ANANG_G00065470 [Anguilla anguilla]